MATLVAWNLANVRVEAYTYVSESSSSPGAKWEIRTEQVGCPLLDKAVDIKAPQDKSEGPILNWDATRKVRRVFYLEVFAPENPAEDVNHNDQWAQSATCSLSIRVSEWAEVAPLAQGVVGKFDAMTQPQWDEWTKTLSTDGQPLTPNKCEASAILTKSINPDGQDPEVTVVAQSVSGSSGSQSSGGIAIDLSWIPDDQGNYDILHVVFGAVPLGAADQDMDFVTVWPCRRK